MLARNFVKNLKSTRLAKGLSQEALARKASISVSYVSMLERAQRTPPLQTVEAVGKALGVSPITLLS